MNNTALRAEAQSANNKHMVFNSEEHEKFYYEKLEQARYQDCYHKALIYILGIRSYMRTYITIPISASRKRLMKSWKI